MMYDRMRDQALQILEVVQTLDWADQPAFRMKHALSKRLKSEGVPVAVAEMLVMRMKITVSESCGQDTDLMHACVDAYSRMILNMRDYLSTHYDHDVHELLLSQAATMEFELTF
jgi:predicted PP-loop superfamily ATPase